MLKKILLIPLLIPFLFSSCKFNNPVGPDEPEKWEYKYDVQVSYHRDVTKIRCPEGPDQCVYLFGELYDPQIQGKNVISIQMTKVAENEFTCIIQKIWVNSPITSTYHVVRVQDCKLAIPGGSPITNKSLYTGENIEIPGSYNHKIVPVYSSPPFPDGSELWFMIK
jgi:hypothetical protein